jgi:hypothetical protein
VNEFDPFRLSGEFFADRFFMKVRVLNGAFSAVGDEESEGRAEERASQLA